MVAIVANKIIINGKLLQPPFVDVVDLFRFLIVAAVVADVVVVRNAGFIILFATAVIVETGRDEYYIILSTSLYGERQEEV